MASPSFTQKKAFDTEPPVLQAASTGPLGAALAPPTYGIGVVDGVPGEALRKLRENRKPRSNEQERIVENGAVHEDPVLARMVNTLDAVK